MLNISDTQKIGLGLAGFGIAFLFFGVVLLFDKGLLAVGNLLFISGLTFIIGIERTFWFFFQRHKIKASGAFFTGILVVLLGWPLVGMIIETYGFILLFRGFIPATIAFLSRVPGLGLVFNLPIIRTIVRSLGYEGRNNV